MLLKSSILGSEMDSGDLKCPREIIKFALKHSERPVVTTKFGPYSGVLLDLVVAEAPNIDVIWINTGFNTKATERHAKSLTKLLNLNVSVYEPMHSDLLRSYKRLGIPSTETSEYEAFRLAVKVEPFERAMAELQPDCWFTGIRKQQSEFRAGLGTFSSAMGGILRVAPLYNFSTKQLFDMASERGLPVEMDYVDVTKADAAAECGIQLL